MKKALFTLAAVAAFGFVASSASAQCNFDAPAKAKGIKSSMIRAYVGCPSITFPAPNTATMAGVPGCAPPTPYSAYQFGVKGKCDLKTSHKVENPCSDGSPSACSNLSLKLTCIDVVKSDGVTPIDDSGWNLNTVARATMDDSVNGDLTVIDFPAQFPLAPAVSGKLKGKFNTNDLLIGLFGPGSALPACTSIEILTVKLADPAGNLFGTLGSAGQ